MFKTKKDIVYIILAGIFITNAIVAELTGGKLIQIGPFIMSIGILPWPIVFITTDIINEHFGRDGVKKLSFITAGLIAYCILVLFIGTKIPAFETGETVNDEQFYAVFGQGLFIMVASIIAFLVSQLIDVSIFWFLRNKTGKKMIWLRSTGSTIFSQLIDSFIVTGIAFWLTGKITTTQYLNMSATGYVFKLILAVVLTPLIYLGHYVIERYLNETNSETDIQ
ncbi:putative integral membrane protein [Flavobacterium enshiense DK69]|uniref:Probable queuosine precursor transporter n=1 Tax=Flavobacterium enshiense DK69 TaxID=1107311 RepID=V6S9Q1_9FLAO|nr:queuosine precursor transporter [Flavobacterium enshiense]ESU23144.1 putative integral membrane protein [Flavobacterium enshiense DK69]KGO95995.1 membrane protein [Flavobacterium enshiense DK69]